MSKLHSSINKFQKIDMPKEILNELVLDTSRIEEFEEMLNSIIDIKWSRETAREIVLGSKGWAYVWEGVFQYIDGPWNRIFSNDQNHWRQWKTYKLDNNGLMDVIAQLTKSLTREGFIASFLPQITSEMIFNKITFMADFEIEKIQYYGGYFYFQLSWMWDQDPERRWFGRFKNNGNPLQEGFDLYDDYNWYDFESALKKNSDILDSIHIPLDYTIIFNPEILI